MNVYEIDPMRDERWDDLLMNHPQASIFHTRAWMEALQRTYDYQPVAFTTARPGCRLTNGVPFCHVDSWISGRRLVSLPFSDHCALLADDPEDLTAILAFLQNNQATQKWKYIEIRPTSPVPARSGSFGKAEGFALHSLDLRTGLDAIFRNCHKDCVQRKVRRAAQEGLTYEVGNSDTLLAKFYGLLLMTRRRHGIPVQPIKWFHNLVACLGDALEIRVASREGLPTAAIMTLRFKSALTYKYGCSDHRFNKLGGIQCLFWNAIQDAKHAGLSNLDMGRSDWDNPGLIKFKDRWGAAQNEITYLRYPINQSSFKSRATQHYLGRYAWSHMPPAVLGVAGKILYKHMG